MKNVIAAGIAALALVGCGSNTNDVEVVPVAEEAVETTETTETPATEVVETPVVEEGAVVETVVE